MCGLSADYVIAAVHAGVDIFLVLHRGKLFVYVCFTCYQTHSRKPCAKLHAGALHISRRKGVVILTNQHFS